MTLTMQIRSKTVFYMFLLVIAVFVIISAASQIHTVAVADIDKDKHPNVYGYQIMNIFMCGIASLVCIYALGMIYVTWNEDREQQFRDRTLEIRQKLMALKTTDSDDIPASVGGSDEAFIPEM